MIKQYIKNNPVSAVRDFVLIILLLLILDVFTGYTDSDPLHVEYVQQHGNGPRIVYSDSTKQMHIMKFSRYAEPGNTITRIKYRGGITSLPYFVIYKF